MQLSTLFAAIAAGMLAGAPLITHAAGAGGTAGQAYPSGQGASSAAQAGLSASAVRQIQQALNDEGYNLQVDGIWGPNTQAAVQQFQQQQGLDASGSVDAETLAALDIDTDSPEFAAFQEEAGAVDDAAGEMDGGAMDGGAAGSGMNGGAAGGMDYPVDEPMQ